MLGSGHNLAIVLKGRGAAGLLSNVVAVMDFFENFERPKHL